MEFGRCAPSISSRLPIGANVLTALKMLYSTCAIRKACHRACAGMAAVFNLACDIGGIGFITAHKADCMLSVLIDTNMLIAARDVGVQSYFYSSSACVYPSHKQNTSDTALKESDVYPAMPEDGYGWEKLFGERMCRHFQEDYGVPCRIGRYHNIFGPWLRL